MLTHQSLRYPQKPSLPDKGAKTDNVTQLNYEEVGTHAGYKTTTKWENFNN